LGVRQSDISSTLCPAFRIRVIGGMLTEVCASASKI